MNTVKKICNYYVDVLGYEGCNILNASGVAAQQSVMHLHFHIIPRKSNDGVDSWPKFEGAKEELAKMHEVLKLK